MVTGLFPYCRCTGSWAGSWLVKSRSRCMVSRMLAALPQAATQLPHPPPHETRVLGKKVQGRISISSTHNAVLRLPRQAYRHRLIYSNLTSTSTGLESFLLLSASIAPSVDIDGVLLRPNPATLLLRKASREVFTLNGREYRPTRYP